MKTTPVTTELRRRLRAPYRVRAVLEIAGVTARGSGWDVLTIDANEWGVRLTFARQFPVGATAHLRLSGPRGHLLDIDGTVLWSRQRGDQSWEAGLDFLAPQRLLSVHEIDAATFAR